MANDSNNHKMMSVCVVEINASIFSNCTRSSRSSQSVSVRFCERPCQSLFITITLAAMLWTDFTPVTLRIGLHYCAVHEAHIQ